MNDYLVFIDTNILLDFYRVRNEAGLTLLNAIDKAHGSIVTTYQVEMEFKKNRQAVIAESLRNLKDRDKVSQPAFLRDSRSADALNQTLTTANRRISRFRDRLRSVLEHPTRRDPVYRVAQRLFCNGSPLNLTRTRKDRQGIKRSALRRFLLGYPPRKQGDTSIGDALNWEWIVAVASTTGSHIVIVSRDSDYGIELNGKVYINDWLVQEFRDRVSKKRQCKLMNRLAPAYKLAGIDLGKAVEQQERAELREKREMREAPPAGIPSPEWLRALELYRRLAPLHPPGIGQPPDSDKD